VKLNAERSKFSYNIEYPALYANNQNYPTSFISKYILIDKTDKELRGLGKLLLANRFALGQKLTCSS